MSWFESLEQALDIDIASQLQEATQLASTYTEFLNLDVLAEQQERDELLNSNDSYDDIENHDDFISMNNNSNINNNNNDRKYKKDENSTPINKKINDNNDNEYDIEDPSSPWDWNTPIKTNNIDTNIPNSTQSDKLSIVDLDNSPDHSTINTNNSNHNINNNNSNNNNNNKNSNKNNHKDKEIKKIDNTLKISKKNTNNSNTNSNSNTKSIEVSAPEYVGKVKRPKSKSTKSNNKNLDFFGLSNSSSNTTNIVSGNLTNLLSDGVMLDDDINNNNNINNSNNNNNNNLKSNSKDVIDDNEQYDSSLSSYSIAIDAIMKSLPQRYSQVEKVFSFFDNDDEIDLSNDPILKQVQENKEKGSSLFKEYSSALAVFDGVSVYHTPQVTPINDSNNLNDNNNDDDFSNNNNKGGGGVKEIVIWIQSLQSEMIIMFNECRNDNSIHNIFMKTIACMFSCFKLLSSLIVQLILLITKVIMILFSFIRRGRRSN